MGHNDTDDGSESALPEVSLERRELIIMGAFAAAGLAASVVPLIGYVSPSLTLEGSGAVAIPADELKLWDARPLIVAARPAYVVRTPSEVLAVASRCTHLSCIVKWQRNRRNFFCPCHGARFAPDGQVLAGPAPGPLPRFEVTETAGQVIVDPA